MENQTKQTVRLNEMRIVAYYAIFSSLWIYLSDSILSLLAGDLATITLLSKIKGIAFIVVSSLLLYRLISRYVQEFRESEQALMEAKETAEAANRAKSQFLANMSHELRTPMSGMLGMLEVVLGGQLDDKQRAYLGTAYNSAHSLVRILNDILEMTKIEAGRIILEEKPFVLRDCVSVATDLFVPEALRKGLDFSVSLDAGLPDTVIGDSLRLQLILTNLVANAVKFTEQGRVEVHVSTESSRDSKRSYTFSVTDSGIGIADEMKHRIFRPFSQVDDSDTRRYGGTGLGLVISKHIVELMGGSIYFESSSGHGSRFAFTLPLPETAGADSDITPKERDNANSGR